jgi:hypothetical protein
MSTASQTPSPASEQPRYLEQRAPILFPEFAKAPETQLHLDLRTLLYLLLRDALGSVATACYRQLGVSELVCFDPTSAERPVRTSDRV